MNFMKIGNSQYALLIKSNDFLSYKIFVLCPNATKKPGYEKYL